MHSTQFFKKMNTSGFAKKIIHRCHLSIHTEANVSSSRELDKWELLPPWAQSEILGKIRLWHHLGGHCLRLPRGDGWRSELFWPRPSEAPWEPGPAPSIGLPVLSIGLLPCSRMYSPSLYSLSLSLSLSTGSFHCRWVWFRELLPEPQESPSNTSILWQGSMEGLTESTEIFPVCQQDNTVHWETEAGVQKTGWQSLINAFTPIFFSLNLIFTQKFPS